MGDSPLRRIAALHGTTAENAKATVASWSQADRELLTRLGMLDGPPDYPLTPAGRGILAIRREGWMDREDFQLCYVEGDWAWFANVAPSEVWGDDWNDAPHDCNAGTPYAKEGQQFVKVAWDGTGYEVNGCSSANYLSVEQINSGAYAWLVDPGYGTTFPNPRRAIFAGTTLAQFKALIREDDGTVYEASSAGEEG